MGTNIFGIASSSICKGQCADNNVLQKNRLATPQNKQARLKNMLTQPSSNQTRLFTGIFKSHVNVHDGCVHQHNSRANKHGIKTWKLRVLAYIVDTSASMFCCYAFMHRCCASMFFSLAYVFRHCANMFCLKTCLHNCHVYLHNHTTLVQAYQVNKLYHSAYMHNRHVYHHQHCDDLHAGITCMRFNKDLMFEWLAVQHSFLALKQYTQTSNGRCASAVSSYIFYQPKF